MKNLSLSPKKGSVRKKKKKRTQCRILLQQRPEGQEFHRLEGEITAPTPARSSRALTRQLGQRSPPGRLQPGQCGPGTWHREAVQRLPFPLCLLRGLPSTSPLSACVRTSSPFRYGQSGGRTRDGGLWKAAYGKLPCADEVARAPSQGRSPRRPLCARVTEAKSQERTRGRCSWKQAPVPGAISNGCVSEI